MIHVWWQIALLCGAALLVGFSKTGVPGSGILVVPMMAAVFGGRLSIGATLPLLIAADCFAVYFYSKDAEWGRLKQLAPWVILGIFAGAAFLKLLPEGKGVKDLLNPIIGGTVLAMLGIHLLRGKLGDKMVPHSPVGTVATGVLAGFTTMASNAAGPIMSIYMTAAGLPKTKLMGTTAWYFFIFNLVKLPFVLLLTANAKSPLATVETLKLDLLVLPLLVIGALMGKKLLPHIPEKIFTSVILSLSAIAAIYLVFKH